MFRVYDCLTSQHDLRLVVVAGVICLLACFTAMNLLDRARASAARQRLAWLAPGAFLAGALVAAVDSDAASHPHFRVKLEAIGYGFLIPAFFVASGARLDHANPRRRPAGRGGRGGRRGGGRGPRIRP